LVSRSKGGPVHRGSAKRPRLTRASEDDELYSWRTKKNGREGGNGRPFFSHEHAEKERAGERKPPFFITEKGESKRQWHSAGKKMGGRRVCKYTSKKGETRFDSFAGEKKLPLHFYVRQAGPGERKIPPLHFRSEVKKKKEPPFGGWLKKKIAVLLHPDRSRLSLVAMK